MDLEYTNSKEIIIPEGYYRLPVGENILNGDYFECVFYWAPTGDGTKNKKVGENGLIYIRKNKDQKTMNIQYKNGKPLIPEGYYQLSNEDLIKEGDYFNCTSSWALTNDYTRNITVGSNVDKMFDNTIYIRKINKNNKTEETQNMNNDLNSLEEQKRRLEQQIKETEDKIRLEKEKKNKLVIGDYIVCLGNPNKYNDYVIGSIVEVIEVDRIISAYRTKSATNEFSTSCFYFSAQNTDWRKATESEVKEYKDEIAKEDLARRFEANKKDMETIKVGEYVVFVKEFEECLTTTCEFNEGKDFIGKVTGLTTSKTEISFNNRETSYFKNRFRRATQQEINEFELKNIEVDDYVVAMANAEGFVKNSVYKIKGFYNGKLGIDVYLDSNNSESNGWTLKNFRKATPEEIAQYQSSFEYKVEKDDYVVNSSGVLMKVSSEGSNSHWFMVGFESYLKSEWELADSEEIESYLRTKAEKNGFKVGAKVQYGKGGSGVIEEVKFMKDKNFPSGACTSNKNILYVSWEGSWGMNFAEIDDNLKIVEEEVEVNGYKAEYYKNYIQFGCAQISLDILYKLSMCFEFKGAGNRVLEGDIKIGAGTFNKQTIEKLLKIHGEKFKTL